MKFIKRSMRACILLAWLGSLFMFICGDGFQPAFPPVFASNLQARGEDTPRAADIFSAASRAMGGEEALKEIQSIEALADCVGPRSKYKTEIISARADRLFFRQTWQDREPFVAVVNGKYA